MNEIIKINNSADAQIKTVLFYAMELVGFNTQNINADSLNIIVRNVKNGFKFLQLEEIKIAFEYGVNGKLGIDLNTYQNFNALYVANVLKAYKSYKEKEYARPRPYIETRPTHVLEVAKKTPEEEQKEWFDFVNNIVQSKKELPFIADWVSVYFYLENNNLINLDNDEKLMFFDLTKSNIDQDFRLKKINGKKADNEQRLLNDERLLKNECRRRLARKYFITELEKLEK